MLLSTLTMIIFFLLNILPPDGPQYSKGHTVKKPVVPLAG